MTKERLEEILNFYLAKPHWHGQVFVRFLIHEGTATIEHWTVELPGAKGNIGRRDHRKVVDRG